MKEITKLDDKYIVIKKEDVRDILDEQDILMLNHFLSEIRIFRKQLGKKDNRYLVLNLDDEINIDYLMELFIDEFAGLVDTKFKVKDISVVLVNAILKAKGE